ncbi:MAG: hypothetical protein SF028_08260 [Candidatus Sumerlaeia bacterium]|nr:hypothetical protein [Candidatus Sumerlaeia bacterium]
MEERLAIDALWSRLESDAGSAGQVRAEAAALRSPAGRMLEGVAAWDAGDAEGALAAFRAAQQAQPGNLPAARYEALALFGAGDAPAAAKLSATLPPLATGAYLRRFTALYWPLRHRTGLGSTAVEADPPEVAHSTDYARFTAGAKCSDTRRRHLAERHLQSGLLAHFKGRYREAEILVGRSWKIFPESIDTAVAHGNLLAARAEEAEALRVLEPAFKEAAAEVLADADKGIVFPPDLASAWAAALCGAGRPQEALAALSLITPQGPDDWGAHWVAALCHLALGDEASFRRQFAVATGPYFIDTWELRIRPFSRRVESWLATEDAARAAVVRAGAAAPGIG